MRLGFFAAATLALLAHAGAETFDGESFGEVRIVAPSNPPARYVTMFSDRDGWSATDDATLDDLARSGALAVGVDTKTYLDNLAAHRHGVRPAECVDVFQDVEDLSRRLQGRHPSPFYNLPIVAGRGQGGALAYVALAQAPVATLSAAAALDPAASVAVTRPLCRLDAFELQADARRLAPVAAPNGELWTAFDAASADRKAFAPMRDASAEVSAAADKLAALVETYAAQAASVGVASLPLVELAADNPSKLAVVFISGDGGWRDLDKTIGEKLRGLGVDVVGWDALRYFWRRKPADETAADLKSVLDAYRAKWGVEKFALVGFSFGADVLPAVYNRLSERDRERVALISLMGLEPKADWEIRMIGWFGAAPSADATPLAPELAKIPGDKVQCFYGVDEKPPGCLDLTDPKMEIVKMPGDHHFDHRYDEIARRIFDALSRRAAM